MLDLKLLVMRVERVKRDFARDAGCEEFGECSDDEGDFPLDGAGALLKEEPNELAPAASRGLGELESAVCAGCVKDLKHGVEQRVVLLLNGPFLNDDGIDVGWHGGDGFEPWGGMEIGIIVVDFDTLICGRARIHKTVRRCLGP